MSNYTKNTNFTAKDNLTSGDPAKVIKGAEFDTEFNSIQTAVNSKADSNNSQLTGSTAAQAITTTGDVTVGGNLAVTGNATISGNLTFGDADTDTVSFSADVNSNIIPDADATYDLGSPTKEWRNLYVDGTANIDSLVADTADINGGTIDGVSITGTTASFSGEISANGGIALGDNDKATFGASDDLQIYHDGSDSIISDTGTGDLLLRGSNSIRLQSHTGETYFKGDLDGSSRVYYDNSEKLKTTATGVDVTGTVTADGFAFDYGDALSLTSGTTGTDLLSTGFVSGQGDYLYVTPAGNSATNNILFKTATGSVYADRLKIANNGDVHFYEDTGTTAKFVWDSSAESLGIGTTSPETNLHVNGGTANTVASFESSDSSCAIAFSDNSTTQWYNNRIGAVGDALTLTTSSAERLRIDSLGNVGIGTASPSEKLTVNGNVKFGAEGTSTLDIGGRYGSSSTSLKLGKGFDGQSYLEFHRSASDIDAKIGVDTAENLVIGNKNATTATIFETNSTERARIDSSGNLLVGSSSVGGADAITLHNSGYIMARNTSDKAGYFDRLSTDGSIVDFRKDGSTVGSIGVEVGNLHINAERELQLRSDRGRTTQVYLGDGGSSTESYFFPIQSNVDLGRTTNNWRDLYLSGGVYLGGTGSVNKLDDYETGSFTPSLSATTTSDFTHSTQDGHYVKVGDLVYFNIVLLISSKGTSSGNIEIHGLPFSQADNLTGTSNESSLTFSYWAGVTTQMLMGNVNSTFSTAIIRKIDSGNTIEPNTLLNASDITNTFSLRVQGTYIAQ